MSDAYTIREGTNVQGNNFPYTESNMVCGTVFSYMWIFIDDTSMIHDSWLEL